MNLIYRFKQAILIIGDLMSFILGFWLSLCLRYLRLPLWNDIERHVSLFFLLFIIWITINFINGLYDLDKIKTKNPYKTIFEAGIFSLIVSVLFFYLIPNDKITPKTILVLNILIGYSLSTIWRIIFNKTINTEKSSLKTLFFGYTQEAHEIIEILQKNPEKGYKPVAVFNKLETTPTNLLVNVYNNFQKIEELIKDKKIEVIIMAPHLKEDEEVSKKLYGLLFKNIQIHDLVSFYENITGSIPISIFSEGWFLENIKNKTAYDKFRKLFDYLAGILIGLIFFALLPIIAFLIKVSSKGPIFIKQKRVGQYGKVFMFYKFRSMYALSPDGSAEIDGVQFAKKDDNRITSVGKVLRKIRLDELPQFLNILKGDIALIGPRPERPEIVEKLQEKMSHYSLRHIIKPGLISWAMIHQNYTDTLETSLQKIQYDLYYIKNKSFILDLSILLRTVNVITRMMGQ